LKNPYRNINSESDTQASSRKEDHIEMAFKSRTKVQELDDRFYYEPMLSSQIPDIDFSIELANKKMDYPIWVSSMTGGTEKALLINKNLATICGEYNLGMGLGSCRQLLYEDKRVHEFNVRELMPSSPLFINLGIAQIEELIENNDVSKILELNDKLNADGLIIHINPLQEWMQPEGDTIKIAPINSVKSLLDKLNLPIIVKEVGQGFGPNSLTQLLNLPLEAIDLAGYGGTNFSKLELLRSNKLRFDCFENVVRLGHSCKEMIGHINELYTTSPQKIACKNIIASGGIKSFLDGYYFINKCKLNTLYAQASGFLKHALDLDKLREYTELQIEGLHMSYALLTLKN